MVVQFGIDHKWRCTRDLASPKNGSARDDADDNMPLKPKLHHSSHHILHLAAFSGISTKARIGGFVFSLMLTLIGMLT